MRCNYCWRELEDGIRCVASACGHLFCEQAIPCVLCQQVVREPGQCCLQAQSALTGISPMTRLSAQSVEQSSIRGGVSRAYRAAVLFCCLPAGKLTCVSLCLQDMSACVPEHEQCCSSGAPCSHEYVAVPALCTPGLATCLCTATVGNGHPLVVERGPLPVLLCRRACMGRRLRQP